MDKERLIQRYPIIYHMAESGTWNSIEHKGLMSTTAVLDSLGISGVLREPFETSHRASKMSVSNDDVTILLRDQKPMPEARLINALQGTISPQDWYKLINEKVFFWATRRRLEVLLNARDYRNLEHDVLTIDSSRLINAYYDRISLCHMNSGNTFPYPHYRDSNIFKSISDYPAKKNGNPKKEVAELVVHYSVPDIAEYVIEVNKMRGSQIVSRII